MANLSELSIAELQEMWINGSEAEQEAAENELTRREDEPLTDEEWDAPAVVDESKQMFNMIDLALANEEQDDEDYGMLAARIESEEYLTVVRY